jgi:hypothetical protein
LRTEAFRAAGEAAARIDDPLRRAQAWAEIALGCFRYAETQLGSEMLEQAAAAIAGTADPAKKADELTFLALVQSATLGDDWALATARVIRDLAFGFEKRKDIVSGAADAARLLARFGDHAAALDCFARCRQMAAEEAAAQDARFYRGRLTYTACMIGEPTLAWDILNAGPDSEESSETAAQVLRTLLSDREWERARRFLEAEPDAERHARLADELTEAEEADRTWGELLDKARALPDPGKAVVALGVLCVALRRCERSADAHHADEWLAEAAEGITDVHRRTRAKHAWSVRDDPMFALGMDDRRFTLMPNPLYHVWRTAEDLSPAQRRAARRCDLLLCRGMVAALSGDDDADDFEEAKRLTGEFSEPLHRAVLLAWLGLASAVAGRPALARGVLAVARKQADGVAAFEHRSVLLRTIGWALFQSGAAEDALSALQQAANFARASESESSRSRLLREVAPALARCGFMDQAVQAAKSVNEESAEKLTEFIRDCSAEGLGEMVFALLHVCVWQARPGLAFFSAYGDLAPQEAAPLAGLIFRWLDIIAQIVAARQAPTPSPGEDQPETPTPSSESEGRG